MEDIMEILEGAICERLELAYFDLINGDQEIRESIESVKELGIRLCENKYIPKEVRRQIEDYKDISCFIEGEMNKFIYMEGIKDCLKLLIRLGLVG